MSERARPVRAEIIDRLNASFVCDLGEVLYKNLKHPSLTWTDIGTESPQLGR